MEDAGFKPDPWQRQLLRSTATRVLILAHRQAGTSTTCAAMATGEALLCDEALVLIISRTQRQADELFRKCVWFYNALARPIPAVQDQARMLTLANGSRVVSLPGDAENLRGFSGPRLVLIDEAARVSDALDAAISPMLATVPDGRMVCLSSPFGRRGAFHRDWEDTQTAWERYRVTAPECSRISREFLEAERIRLGQRLFNQEYLCEFGDAEDNYFDSLAVEAAFNPDLQPLILE
jgi:hypothetical protein